MANISVNVTGTIRLPSGLPASYATVRFTLSNPALLGVTVVVPTNTTATADINGAFSVALLPNLKFAYYTVTVSRATGAVLMETVAVIPAYDCQFSQVIQTRVPSPASATVAATAQLLEAQATLEATRQQVLSLSVAITNIDGRTVPVKAAISLGGNRAVVMNRNGEAIYADSGVPFHFGLFAGITTGAFEAGTTATIVKSGLIVEPSWSWVPNAPVFLGFNGVLVQAQPLNSFQQVVGIALSATNLFINNFEPTLTIN